MGFFNILRYRGLESRGVSFVNFTKGIVRGVETEDFVDNKGVPKRMRVTGKFRLANKSIRTADEMSPTQLADAAEKVAWLAREAESRRIEVVR